MNAAYKGFADAQIHNLIQNPNITNIHWHTIDAKHVNSYQFNKEKQSSHVESPTLQTWMNRKSKGRTFIAQFEPIKLISVTKIISNGIHAERFNNEENLIYSFLHKNVCRYAIHMKKIVSPIAGNCEYFLKRFHLIIRTSNGYTRLTKPDLWRELKHSASLA